MIFNVTGGGGAALNFKVVGYATKEELLAATPAENTIGIITEIPITGYHFGTEEPSPAAAGMVWITTGTSSAIEFNALKKNAIQVYPLSAKQQDGSAWVDVTALSYQGGAWVDWIPEGTLYYDGNELTKKTGGWNAVSGNVVKNSDHMVISGVTATKNKISTVGYKTIEITCLGSGKGLNFGLGTANNLFSAGQVALPSGTVGTARLDITGAQGQYYPIFACNTDSNIKAYRVIMTTK